MGNNKVQLKHETHLLVWRTPLAAVADEASDEAAATADETFP